jgi:hypothetical protein
MAETDDLTENLDGIEDDATVNSAESAAPTPAKKKDQENPLVNLMVNVLVPVVALTALSKDDDKFWHIGPLYGMIVAVAFPVCYGTWYLISKRKVNFFSVLGIVSVLLTGGITLYVWNNDGTVKPNAAVLFAIKEAMIPTVFGILILGSHWSAKPLVRLFLYNPDLFDVPRIEKAVKQNSNEGEYNKALFTTTVIMSASFFLSAVMNYFLAMYFLEGKAATKVAYNEALGNLTGWGYAVIAAPLMVIWLLALWMLVKRLKTLTELDTEKLMIPR